MSYPITAIDDIDADEADALKAVGIRTAEKLLEAAKSPKGRKLLSAQTDLDEKRLLRWANIADKLRIKGMGREYAGLLCEVGVDTVTELQYRNPARLAKSMAEANKKRKLVRFLPSEKLVTRWVEHARKLPRNITYGWDPRSARTPAQGVAAWRDPCPRDGRVAAARESRLPGRRDSGAPWAERRQRLTALPGRAQASFMTLARPVDASARDENGANP